jgi:ABC-type multidrug transport system fused ATPase/permease subunit
LFGIAKLKAINMKLQLELAYNSCNVNIPGSNKDKYELFLKEYNDIQDYIMMYPVIWNTIVLVILNIISMKNIYMFITMSTLILCSSYILLKTLDDNVYRRTKPEPLKIFSLDNPQYNYCRLTLGANPDFNYNYNKKIKMMYQHHYRTAIISVLDCIYAIMVIYNGNKRGLLNFMSISWMIGSFCDNIKSYKYHYTIDEYYKMLDGFNMYKRNYTNSKIITRNNKSDGKLHFKNVSYEYIVDLFADSIQSVTIIKNLSFTFEPEIYYLESPNGRGKSTFLKSIIHHIKSGSIIYDGIDIHKLNMIELYRTVCYVKQSSDFMPKYDKDTVTYFISKNVEMAKDFDVYQFMNKSSNELSGGEKQRLNIFLALNSNCKIILFDEIFSEISSIPSEMYPNGIREYIVLQLNKWNKILKRIIIIVGHGITIKDSVKLELQNSDVQTTLYYSH